MSIWEKQFSSQKTQETPVLKILFKSTKKSKKIWKNLFFTLENQEISTIIIIVQSTFYILFCYNNDKDSSYC